MSNMIFKGTLNWTRTGEPDHKFDNESTDGKWSTQIIPERDDLDKIRDLQSEGLKNVVKKNDNNEYYVNFGRVHKKLNPKTGEVKKINKPPFTLDADGNAMDPKLIGNGSKGEVHLRVYEHPTPTGNKAKAAELEGVKITELVEYKSGSF